MKASEEKSKWEAFRSEVIRLDDGKCVKCGKTESDGIILQVHHLKYRQGVKKWEYSHDECETLCKGCHAGLHGKILPKTGWKFEFEDDLGDLEGECERCGTSIRYAFYISHSLWPRIIQVGTYCCDNLTDTDTASNSMELKNKYMAKLNRFVKSPSWLIYPNSDSHSLKRKGKTIVIQKNSNNNYVIKIDNNNGRKYYLSLEEAKKRVFEVLENGEYDKYLSIKNIK
jgi:hypothetical protein